MRSCGSGAGPRAVEGCETGRRGAPDPGAQRRSPPGTKELGVFCVMGNLEGSGSHVIKCILKDISGVSLRMN